MSADYRQFLTPKAPVVLPYFGGTRVDAADRRLRVETELAPGWWCFQIEGRKAVPKEPATPPDLGSLPALRGHWAAGWVVADGKTLGRIALPPDDEPPPLSKVVARRWYSHDWLFDTIEFEDDAEGAARRALEEGRPLGGDIKGVVPSLRAAFGYALGLAIAAELRVDVSMRELTPRVVAIADGGRPAVEPMFRALIAEREREAEAARRRAEAQAIEARLRVELAEQAERVAGAIASVRVRDRRRDPRQHADDVLDNARARMLACRTIARGQQLDITYEVDGERILSLVDAETLQVLDPGICLSGAHAVLTLDAMPSVVREAIEENHLNITRRS